MMKRVLAILMTAMMLLSMIPAAAFAEEVNSEQITEMSAQLPEESANREALEGGEEEPTETEITVPDSVGEDPAFYGRGSEEEPYEIDSEGSLRLLASLVNEGIEEYAGAYYVLKSDICLTAAWTPIGSEEHPFKGSIDGNGKKIAGLSADSGAGCFGLFGAAKDARISGIALEDVNIEATGYAVVGAIVGYMQGGSLSESYVAGTVSSDIGKHCGGLVGCADGAEIVNCFSTVEMTADGYTGGIAGFGCDGTTIGHCYNIGFIFSTGKGAFGSVLGNEGENIDLSSCYCIDTTDKGAVFLTREEAADASSFEGFDFDGVWFVDKSSEYPYPVLKANPCRCDAKWAPDTTEYEKGYVDNEEHSTSLSKNAMIENDTKNADAYASAYIIPNLPAVRNQSPYGTCWAHAIIAAAETNLIKKGYADSSVNLSELQFVWFHHNGTLNDAGEYEDPLNNFGGDRNYSYSTKYGFWGGDNYYAASKSLASWIGPINEDETTAYSQANAESIVANNGLNYSYAFSSDAVHLENVKMIPTNSGTDAVKNAILKYGALCVSYMSDSGYTTSSGRYFYSSVGTDTDHAVCIVGWDDNISKNLFYDKNNDAAPKNDGAWIVRNSWGSSWGDNGYFYMSYESSYVTSSDKNLFAFDLETADSYEKCYQYDGTARFGCASGFSTSKPAVANIFTASGNDTISAVSFWMEDNSDLNYTVKVYTNISDSSNPTSGTLAASVSGQTDYTGYYTVALPNPVSVSSGTKFSVVLEIKNDSGETIWFPYDAYRYFNENDYYDAHSEAGQSFYSSNGINWTDKGKDNGGNYRIKAFTADNPTDPRPLAPTVSMSTASGKMALSWNSVNNAAGYTVYRAVIPDGSYSQVGTTTSTSYTDTTAVSGTVYYYKVTAFTANGNESRYSNTVSGLVGTQTSFVVSYDANGGNAAPVYQIKTAGTALTLSEEVPYRNNYTFLGWSEDSTAKKADYAPGASFTKDADTTLYAVWIDGIVVNSIEKLESEHNYADGIDQKWYFTAENAVSITLTFDSKTKTEENYDFIYIYDGNKNLIGKYTGSGLSCQTVTIPGDTVCIRLTSDGSYNHYGFEISKYEITYKTQHTVKFVNDDGTELQSGSWYYGETPKYTGETPTKASTAQYTYTFTGWSPAITAVTGDTTYTAQFMETVRQYPLTINYVSADSSFVAPTAYTASVNYGSSYSKASPSVKGYVCDTTTVSGTMGVGATVNVTYYKVGFTWDGTSSAAVNAGSVIVNASAAINSKVTVNATCTVNGTTAYTASYTAQDQTFIDVKTANDVPAINHANKVHHAAAAATCLAAGNIEYYYCPDCKCCFTTSMSATTAEAVEIAKLDHEYVFDANTDTHTITATCKNGCNASEILTLTTPVNPVYDGNAKTVTADKPTLGGATVGAVSYFVKDAQGAWISTNEVVNAGFYKATVSVGGVEIDYTFTVSKATPEISLSCADIDDNETPTPEYEVRNSDAVPVITYSSDGVDYGTWDEVKSETVTYYVKAYIAGTDNSEEAVAIDTFSVSRGCTHIEIVSIDEGRYLLYFNETEVGYVTLTKSGNQWAINVEGKGYLSYNNSNVYYSDTPYYWTHNGIGFCVIKSETTGFIFKKTKQVTYYLSYGGESIGYPLTKDTTIAILMKMFDSDEHEYAYLDNGNGTHTKYCTACGKEKGTLNCEYDESTHRCKFCGSYDPSAVSVNCEVSVTTTSTSGIKKLLYGKYTYTVSIIASAEGDNVKSVQYSTNGSSWTTGTSFSQYKAVDILYVRVTTANNGTHNFVYRNGITSPGV